MTMRKGEKAGIWSTLKSLILEQNVVVHTCNPAFGRRKQEDLVFQSSLGCNSETLSQKNNTPPPIPYFQLQTAEEISH
jgi:hypothetical protein